MLKSANDTLKEMIANHALRKALRGNWDKYGSKNDSKCNLNSVSSRCAHGKSSLA